MQTAAATSEAGQTPDLEQLVRDHWAPTYRVVMALVRDHALAEDITQEALLKAWKALPGFRGDASLRNWVLRIAHNTAISVLRSRKPEPREPWNLPESISGRDSSDLVIDELMLQQFQTALSAMPASTRAIVVLREVEGRSYEEIADIVRLPLSTVRTRLFRARKELAVALKGWR
ncbi:MAG: sigma-70 family RNA polymerase sigma factor [Acidimicrobiia bacterium]|nr:sigma-70 family RNA polymerase sigma factor [Acidimicrobiia bacterium]